MSDELPQTGDAPTLVCGPVPRWFCTSGRAITKQSRFTGNQQHRNHSRNWVYWEPVQTQTGINIHEPSVCDWRRQNQSIYSHSPTRTSPFRASVPPKPVHSEPLSHQNQSLIWWKLPSAISPLLAVASPWSDIYPAPDWLKQRLTSDLCSPCSPYLLQLTTPPPGLLKSEASKQLVSPQTGMNLEGVASVDALMER